MRHEWMLEGSTPMPPPGGMGGSATDRPNTGTGHRSTRGSRELGGGFSARTARGGFTGGEAPPVLPSLGDVGTDFASLHATVNLPRGSGFQASRRP